MRQKIKNALKKIDKMISPQLHNLFLFMVEEIDRLETVLDSYTNGILVCDSENNLILANKYSKRFLPLSWMEEKPEKVWNIITDKKTAAFLEEALLSGDRVDEKEFEIETHGITRLFAVSIFPLVKDYRVTGSVIRIADITEKRRKDARMRQIENLASLTTLAAGVAHEIKNPLGSISIHIQLLQKAFARNEELYYLSHPKEGHDPGVNNEEKGPSACFAVFRRYIDVINEEIERLNHIIVDFLFAVRPMTLNLREANFNAFLQDLAEFTAYELSDANVDLELELDENLPLLDFDEQLMKQALLNLIQNAVAAMEAGGTITLKTEQRDNEVVVSIADTGKGIPDTIMAKIFEPYFTTKERGSGLGLTLVFKIIREHKGEIGVSSKKGEGACFTITLPVPQRERRLLSSGEEDKRFTIEEVK